MARLRGTPSAMKPQSLNAGKSRSLTALMWHTAQLPLAGSLKRAKPVGSSPVSVALPRSNASYLLSYG